MDVLDKLYNTLDRRPRPEDVAVLLLDAHIGLSGQERALVEHAAQYASRWSSLLDDFERPVSASRQLDTYAYLFGADRSALTAAELDVDQLRHLLEAAAGTIGWDPRFADFSAHRMNRERRAAAGLGDLSKRRYNKQYRYLRRFREKIDRLEHQLRVRGLVLAGRAGLVGDITPERFRSDVDAACFVAYYTARRKTRRRFALEGKDNPFDEIAEMLYRRCEANPGTDWWMISRVYPSPEVVARLTAHEQGELIGRWSALMRAAADVLGKAWQPAIDRRRMIVRKGIDSFTWNVTATAYNAARDGWINSLAAVGALDLLDLTCPPKAMRLMAADLAWWHDTTGGGVDPDTAVWAELPLPWLVLDGRAVCTRGDVVAACHRHGVDPEARGWVAPRAAGPVAEFTPTPELVHGVAVADPLWAALLRRGGAFSGKVVKPWLVALAAAGA